MLSPVPRASAEMVAAAVRTVFAQPDATHVRRQLEEITRMLAGQFPDVATMVCDAAEDLLAFTGFPQAHWRKLWSTNPLERLNGEIKRRTNVVGIFPNDASIARLVTAVVVEAHDEWGRRAPLPVGGVHDKALRRPCRAQDGGAAPGRYRLSQTVDVEPLKSASSYTTPRGVIARRRHQFVCCTRYAEQVTGSSGCSPRLPPGGRQATSGRRGSRVPAGLQARITAG